MDKVVDTIQKNLPASMLLHHWKIGPMHVDFGDNALRDLKGHSSQQQQQSQSEYNLMDEQVAMATAAAAVPVSVAFSTNEILLYAFMNTATLDWMLSMPPASLVAA